MIFLRKLPIRFRYKKIDIIIINDNFMIDRFLYNFPKTFSFYNLVKYYMLPTDIAKY